jgi:hypothetical protein
VSEAIGKSVIGGITNWSPLANGYLVVYNSWLFSSD